MILESLLRTSKISNSTMSYLDLPIKSNENIHNFSKIYNLVGYFRETYELQVFICEINFLLPKDMIFNLLICAGVEK